MLDIIVTPDPRGSVTDHQISTELSTFHVLILPNVELDHGEPPSWRCEIRWARATFLGRGASPEHAFTEGLMSLLHFGGTKPVVSDAEWVLVRARLAELGAFGLGTVTHRRSGTFRAAHRSEQQPQPGPVHARSGSSPALEPLRVALRDECCPFDVCVSP